MPAPVVDQPQNSSAQTKSQNTLLPHSSHGQGGVPVPNFPMQLSVQPAQLSQSQSLIGSSHSHVRQTSAPGDLGPNSSKSARKKRARLEIDQ